MTDTGDRPEWVTVDSIPDPPGRSPEGRAFAAEAERDSAEQCVRALLAAHYVGPAADDEGVPCPEGDDLTAITEHLYEGWQAGASLDDLAEATRKHVRGWAEEVRA